MLLNCNAKLGGGGVYIDIWNKFAIPYLYDMGKINDYWFIQDDARPHRTQKAFDLLAEHFHNGMIRLYSEKKTENRIDWPPYSLDLQVRDFFLWKHLK